MKSGLKGALFSYLAFHNLGAATQAVFLLSNNLTHSKLRACFDSLTIPVNSSSQIILNNYLTKE